MPFGPPVYLMLLVRPDGPVKDGGRSQGPQDWCLLSPLAHRLARGRTSRQQGWRARHRARRLATAHVARLHQDRADRWHGDRYHLALRAEQAGEGRILLGFGDLVRDFHTHIIYAANKLITAKPDTVRRFNAGWFDTIAFMRANKAET